MYIYAGGPGGQAFGKSLKESRGGGFDSSSSFDSSVDQKSEPPRSPRVRRNQQQRHRFRSERGGNTQEPLTVRFLSA